MPRPARTVVGYPQAGNRRIFCLSKSPGRPSFLESNADANGAIVNGSSFTQADNGGYFDSNPSSAEVGGSILIAQFTFAEGSTWTYTGTSDFNAGGDTLTNVGFSVSNVPAPGALALLGLAGFGRRRRG